MSAIITSATVLLSRQSQLADTFCIICNLHHVAFDGHSPLSPRASQHQRCHWLWIVDLSDLMLLLVEVSFGKECVPRIQYSGILASPEQSLQHSEFIEGGFSETHVCRVPHLLPLQMPEPCCPPRPILP